ncbi:MAG: TonB-dependent receptor, partial [Venatoribacter sp.]
YRQGNQGIQDAIISHSAMLGQGSLRLTGSYLSDDGFDGEQANPGEDLWDDDKRNKFVSADYQQRLNETTGLQVHFGASKNYAEIAASPTPDTSYLDNNAFSFNTKLNFDFSERHQSHLQLYWQREDRTYIQYDERPTVLLDPDLAKLYQLNPNGVKAYFGGDNSGFTTAAELALLNNILTRAGSNIDQQTQGYIDYNYIDQRIDIEWQDTIVWSDSLRTISGASYRRDEAYSESVFGGWRSNDTYRLFANAEWRLLDWLMLNAGGMYEKEELNNAVFSPRIALNTLLSDTQSIRMIYSQAVRSPDMMEQSPHMVMVARGLTDNYLGFDEATLGITNIVENRGLKHEQITSYELGYYYLKSDWNLELDLKVYKEELRHLIDDTINLENSNPTSDGWANIQGAELQLKWQPITADWLWLTVGKMDVDAKEPKEERLSPKTSVVTSWHHQGKGWSSTVSHFYLDALRNDTKLYHRAELNLRKEWQFNRYKPWAGVFWQHQFAHNSLGYREQIYSKPNIYYFQAGLNF